MNYYIENKRDIYNLAMSRAVTTGVALDMYMDETGIDREKYGDDEMYFKTLIDVYTDGKVTVNGEKVNQADFFDLEGELPHEIIIEIEKRMMRAKQ